jgi:hypothetical protein
MELDPHFQPRGRRRPKTGAERAADVRRRHPDYNRNYKAKRRAACLALMRATWPQVGVEEKQVEQVAVVWPPKPVLMLPAPVVDPLMLEIEQMRARLKALQAAHIAR